MKKIKIGQFVLYAILFSYTVICLLPVVLVAIISFTSEASLGANGYSFFPEQWSTEAWVYVWGLRDRLFQAYKVTIAKVAIATVSQLLIESMMAYALSRQNFLLRGLFTKILLFTALFSGGMLSSYMINTSVYHLKDTFLILCIPGVSMMHVVMMRTYIKGTISDSVIESVKMDGASDLRTYAQIVLPLMKPSLAAVGFMTCVGNWNEWVKGDMYITAAELKPLQNYLMSIENYIASLNTEEMESIAHLITDTKIPADSTRMALLFTVLGPIMIAYPFFQKYFVKGLTVGAVKG